MAGGKPDNDPFNLDEVDIDDLVKPAGKLEKFLYNNRYFVALLLAGITFLGAGLFLFRAGGFDSDTKIEIIESASDEKSTEILAEIAGAVQKPGVYQFKQGDRIEDLLIASGGLSADADRNWVERFINRAAKLADGQKVFIPRKSAGEINIQQSADLSANNLTEGLGGGGSVLSESIRMVNINTANSKELESLWGIGPVSAQKIIEQRPYSSVEELLTKKILKSNVYERNKDLMTVY